MKLNTIFWLTSGLIIFAGGLIYLLKTSKGNFNSALNSKLEDLNLYDSSRQRSIPVALYSPESDSARNGKLIIFNHGYGHNKGDDYKEYTYLTEYFSAQGYLVASIQHELPADDLLPKEGKAQVVRMPNWKRGVQNILFVINALKKIKPELDYTRLILIGHSNGGDMAMLFAHMYPDLVDKIISLDSRRMPFPRRKQPKILSLRSSDQSADEGVLPTQEEEEKYGIKIIQLKDTRHNDMEDHANEAQRKEINGYILDFLINH